MPNSEPSAIPSIALPVGGKLLAFVNPRIQSADCETTTNLQTQVAPLIASMVCQFQILDLLKPLIEIIQGLPNPPGPAIARFSKAAAALAPCLLARTPASVVPFVRDLLCLEIRSLHCFLHNLETISALQDAGTVSASEVQNVLDSYAPVAGILELAGGLFQAAGLALPRAPTLPVGTDRNSLNADHAAVTSFTGTLQTATDALGGCSS